MSGMFFRVGGACVGNFRAEEAAVVRRLVEEVGALVDAPGRPMTGDAGATDPVISRLFPDAYRDEPDEAAEFRRLTERDLRAGKRDQVNLVLRTLPAEGGQVRLDAETADGWLRTLTDVRLALGMTLELNDDTDIEEELDEAVLHDPTSPRVAQLSVYAYLTYLQESLVDALTDE